MLRFLVAGVLLGLSSVNVLYIKRHYDSPHREYSYIGHDFPQTLPLTIPDLPPVYMTVEESVHYQLGGRENDAEWLSLTPKINGWGYVRLGPEHRLFAVAMFHQLHCLRLINLSFDPSARKTVRPAHTEHCLNYLRQAALCAADTTLERGDFTTRDFDAQRVGETHVCRNWEVVYATMRGNMHAWTHVNDSIVPPFLPEGSYTDVPPWPLQPRAAIPNATWAIPPLPRVHLMVDSSHYYTMHGDDAWSSALPPGGGLLYFRPSDSDAPPLHTSDVDDDEEQVYSISMFHQIRCMDIIRRELNTRLASTDPSTLPAPSRLSTHCMNYIRQMLLCRADTRLQSCRKHTGQQISVSSVTHTCWDWSAVYAEAERNWERHVARRGLVG